jgi:hypothetical protein
MAQTVRGNAGQGHRSVSRGPRFARPEISWGDFATLRLSQFIPAAEINALRDWEFMDLRWIGEAVGFTEWLRRKDDPNVLRSIALDLDALDASVVDAVLERLNLPLHAGMTRKRLVRLLGEPTNVLVFPKAVLTSLQNRGEMNAPDVRRSRATGALSGITSSACSSCSPC